MNPRLRSAIIIAAVVLLDRITKVYLRAHVSTVDVFPVIPGFFNIIHTENPGAAFGVLAELNTEWRSVLLIGVSLLVMAVIGAILFRPSAASQGALLQTGLALVFGGALGNLWDRVAYGRVTDFLQFFFGSYEFPAFNAADSAITVGAALLFIDMWRNRSGQKSQ